MRERATWWWLVPIVCALGCKSEHSRIRAGTAVATVSSVVDSFSAVPDSAWIEVQGPTIIAFFPRTSNVALDRDGGLATALDDLNFRLGSASDTLQAHGFRMSTVFGDTLWLRAAAAKWRFVRDADSAVLGLYLTSPDRRQTVRYGTGSECSLVALADTFLRRAAVPYNDIAQSGSLPK